MPTLLLGRWQDALKQRRLAGKMSSTKRVKRVCVHMEYPQLSTSAVNDRAEQHMQLDASGCVIIIKIVTTV